MRPFSLGYMLDVCHGALSSALCLLMVGRRNILNSRSGARRRSSEDHRERPIPLPKSHVSQFSGVKRTMTDSDVFGLFCAYHLPSSGPR